MYESFNICMKRSLWHCQQFRSAVLFLGLLVSDLEPIAGKDWCDLKKFPICFKFQCSGVWTFRTLSCQSCQRFVSCFPFQAQYQHSRMQKQSHLMLCNWARKVLNASGRTFLAKIFLVPEILFCLLYWLPIKLDAGSKQTWLLIKVMKMAMRFEALLLEKKASGSASDKSDRDLIQEASARYNDHQANSAIKRWQLNADVTTAIIGVVCGMSAECRQIVRDHLNHNKWEESGAWADLCICLFLNFLCGWLVASVYLPDILS